MATHMLAADREGQVGQAEAFARRALELAERSQAPSAAALASGELAWLALGRHDFDRADRYLADGIAWARRAAKLSRREGGYDGYEAQLQLIAMRSLQQRNRPFEVLRRVREVLVALPPHRLRDRINVLLCQAIACASIGDLREASEFANEAVRIARAIEVPRILAEGLVGLASASGSLGDHERQLVAATEAATLARTVQVNYALALALDQQADAKCEQEQYDEARALWRESLALYQSQEQLTDALAVKARLARLDALTGSPEAIEEARSIVRSVLRQASGTSPNVAQSDADVLPGAFPLANAPTLVTCLQVLVGVEQHKASGDPDVWVPPVLHELGRRLQVLRAQAPDAEGRERIEALPYWRATLHWLSAELERPDKSPATD